MNKFYAVRWFDSEYYTSVNHVEYVFDILSTPRPDFYNFLIYELIETDLTFRELTLKLPFDKNLKRISVNKLQPVELAKLKYHIAALRKSNTPTAAV